VKLSPNLWVQVLVVASGLLVNFLMPALFGLSAYGELLRQILVVLTVHRFLDLTSEPYLATADPRGIYLLSLCGNILTSAALIVALSLLGFASVDFPLLAAMTITLSVMLAFHRGGDLRGILSYLVTFNAAFVVLCLLRYRALIDFSLRDILLFTNLWGAIFGSAWLIATGAIERIDGSSLRRSLRAVVSQTPQAWLNTAFSTYLTTVFTLIMSGSLGNRDLGNMRVFASVVQSALGVFPANIKAIFVSFRHTSARNSAINLLDAAFWFFFLLTLAFVGVSVYWPQYGMHLNAVLLLWPYFSAACLERYAQLTGRTVALRWVGVTGFVAFAWWGNTTHTLQDAMLQFACGVVLYASALAVVNGFARDAHRMAWLPIVSGALSYSVWTGVCPPWLAAVIALCVGGLAVRPRRSHLRYLLGHL